ncbi:MAG: YdiU family protein [Deltaproteobacteria bacterium]|nr:YdiU family protein [Deltaproteobacteria bacterium]
MEAAELEMYRQKFGLVAATPNNEDEAADRADADRALVRDLLARFERRRLDYTITFDQLRRCLKNSDADALAGADQDALRDALGEDFARWRIRIGSSPEQRRDADALMRRSNPVVIPRNHHVEAALRACTESGETTEIEQLLDVLKSPYETTPTTPRYQDAPLDGDANYQTFCGT